MGFLFRLLKMYPMSHTALSKNFKWTNIYSWGLPTLIVAAAFLTRYLKLMSKNSTLNFGDESCWIPNVLENGIKDRKYKSVKKFCTLNVFLYDYTKYFCIL